MKKRLFGILICTILLFVFAGICTCAEESSEEWKIGVVVYDPENPEMEMFLNYYRDYIEEGFPVKFYFSDAVSSAEEENDFILDDYEVNYDEEYNDLKKYTEKENSLKATEFYRNDKFVYKITRIGNLFRANITAGIKKNRTTRLKGTRNDNGLLYVFIDKKKYLLAKLVYKYFGDREKIIAVGDDGVIIYRDGNKINLRIENLDYISRSEFNKTRDINKKIKHNRKSNKQNN